MSGMIRLAACRTRDIVTLKISKFQELNHLPFENAASFLCFIRLSRFYSNTVLYVYKLSPWKLP